MCGVFVLGFPLLCASAVGKEYILSYLQILGKYKRFQVRNVERVTSSTNDVLFVDVYMVPLVRFVVEQMGYFFVGLFARMLVVGKDFVPDFDVLYRFRSVVRFNKSSFAEAFAVGACLSCAPVALKTHPLNKARFVSISLCRLYCPRFRDLFLAKLFYFRFYLVRI